MRYLNKLTGPAMLVLLAACGQSAGSDRGMVIDTTIQPRPAVATPTNSGTGAQPVLPAVAAPVATGGALNPAHGQPGHRCDIAVGAPLNSQPASPSPTVPVTTSPAPASQPAVITAPAAATTLPASPASTTATAPGMNPPHGQPGHRCDIAVGAPLNSKPAAATTATPLPLSPSIPAATPVTTAPVPVKAETAATVATAPGMNPPHGQPGHRCDIAVGAPLNSKPADKLSVVTSPEKEKPEPEKNKPADKIKEN